MSLVDYLARAVRRRVFAVEGAIVRRRLEIALNQIGSDAAVAELRADVDRQIRELRWSR